MLPRGQYGKKLKTITKKSSIRLSKNVITKIYDKSKLKELRNTTESKAKIKKILEKRKL